MLHSPEQKENAAISKLGAFPGFAAPTSNTTFTPNQFFDVCLPNYSRGVVRLVAYLIRQTLGWCDANGNPLHERVRVSYRELVQKAGISRGLIRKTLDEAIRGGFIECTQTGKAATAYARGESAHYQLRWDERPDYVKDPAQFRGFFEGEGNRTDIPNQFFDHVIPNEPLSVTKVVGSIIRFSIGFQARHGRRRQQAQLSYRDIQRYAKLRDTHSLSDAIRIAEAHHYILRLQHGIFDPNAGAESRPAIFTLRWADSSPFFPTGSKTPAAENEVGQFKNPSGTGSENPAEHRFDFPSGIQTKQRNEINKQQQDATPEAIALLQKEGFTEKTAKTLADRYPVEQIRTQVEWLARRGPTKNRLGMLRRAIEENWPAPEELRHAEVSDGREFAQHFYAGLAGNPGLPVAEPSSHDAELAARFVERLRAVAPAPGHPAVWAREFAAYASERRKERDVVSLVLALRVHGDAWLLRFGREQQRRREEISEAARAAHREKHEEAWLRFIAETERACRTERPVEYTAFLRGQEGQRWLPSAADPERARLFAFQRHFHLPDFWAWDAEFNSEPFKPCA